jgi:hypothetical protein
MFSFETAEEISIFNLRHCGCAGAASLQQFTIIGCWNFLKMIILRNTLLFKNNARQMLASP